MIRCIFQDRLEIIGRHVVRVVNARWNGNSRTGIKEGNMDVFRQYDDGSEEVRNLAYSTMGGYFIYDTTPEEWDSPAIRVAALCTPAYDSSNKVFTNISAEEREMVERRHPEFRWLMAKILDRRPGVSCCEVFEYLKAWLLWPECERLYNAELYKLCTSRAFARASYREQVRIAAYLKAHPEINDPGLGEIRQIMKNGWSQDEYNVVKRYRIDDAMLRYLKSQLRKGTIFREEYSLEALYGIYDDYIQMAKECGHDMADAYWKYPSDLRKAHEKVMMESAIQKAARLLEKQKKYADAVKKFVGKVLKDGNIDVFVPGEVKDIAEQATVLHQCLVSADYIGKVIDRDCLLVFIRKQGKPVATAELDRNGKVVQFYGDESVHDYDLMKPSAESEEALNKWIKEYRPRIRKVKEAE